MKAISIKQPWAWAIIHAGKDVENRTWHTNYRGPLLIHASKTFDTEGFHWILENQKRLNIRKFIPVKSDYLLGGIIGKVYLKKCVRSLHYSPWMFDPWGFVLEKPEPLKFIPYPGQLGLFEIPSGCWVT